MLLAQERDLRPVQGRVAFTLGTNGLAPIEPSCTRADYDAPMGSRKIRRKTKKTKKPAVGEIRTVRHVRLKKQEALELQRLAMGAGLEEAKRHLRMIRPRLDETAVHEVAWRCEDPMARGGIDTGSDEQGDYADVAVTA